MLFLLKSSHLYHFGKLLGVIQVAAVILKKKSMVNNNTDLWLRISGILRKKKKKVKKREQSVSDSLFQRKRNPGEGHSRCS